MHACNGTLHWYLLLRVSVDHAFNSRMYLNSTNIFVAILDLCKWRKRVVYFFTVFNKCIRDRQLSIFVVILYFNLYQLSRKAWDYVIYNVSLRQYSYEYANIFVILVIHHLVIRTIRHCLSHCNAKYAIIAEKKTISAYASNLLWVVVVISAFSPFLSPGRHFSQCVLCIVGFGGY